MQKTEVDLNELINDSIFIIREVKSRFKNPAIMWSTGKDSTSMLALIRRAFYGEIPFPVIHIDTSYKFPEIYEFRDKIAKEWNLNLIIGKNEEALKSGVCIDKGDHLKCCNALKTEALKIVLEKYKFDALIMSIRHDEHYMRNLERYFSPRDKEFKWHILRPKTESEIKEGDAPFVSEQQPELWNLYQTDFGPDCSHVRIHPLLLWTELDIWRFIKREKIPINPLYFADYVEKRFGWKNKRFRSLGCMPCTKPVVSNAKTIDEIIEELRVTDVEERSGRSQDKEAEEIMRKLRCLGYM